MEESKAEEQKISPPQVLETMFWSGLSGGMAFLSAWSLNTYTTERVDLLQEYLSRAPELTNKVIEATNQFAGTDFIVAGGISAVLSGICLGMAMYTATRK